MDALNEFLAIQEGLTYWHWWAVAALLIVLEVVILPGSTFFLFPGIAAIIVGLVVWVFPEIGWMGQAGLFAVLSFLSIWGWRYWRADHPPVSTHPRLNMRSASLIGHRGHLDHDLVDGAGNMVVADTRWSVRSDDGSDLSAGTRVEITDARGAVLIVRALDLPPVPMAENPPPVSSGAPETGNNPGADHEGPRKDRGEQL